MIKLFKHSVMINTVSSITPKHSRSRRSRRERMRAYWKKQREYESALASKKKRKRKGKKNWNEGSLWKMIHDPDMNDPSSDVARNFRTTYRVPFPVFLKLVKKCNKHKLFGISGRHGNCIPVEIKLLCILRFLARGHEALTLRDLTSIGRSTIHNIVKTFLENFVRVYESKWIHRKPTESELKDIMATYAKLGFPGAIGSVDCTHIWWSQCPHSMTNLCSGRDDRPTVVFQCVVDHNRYIWNCSKGFVGRFCDQNVSDADPFLEELRLRRIYEDLEYQIYDNKGVLRTVKGVYLLCDNGYKKEIHLMCPYTYRSVKEEVYFSEYLESVRKDVECTFGILKARFRILRTGIEYHDMATVENIFKACCILHNMILRYDIPQKHEWEDVNWEQVDPTAEVVTLASADDDSMSPHVLENVSESLSYGIKAAGSVLEFQLLGFESKRKALSISFSHQWRLGKLQWPRSADKGTKTLLKSAGAFALQRAEQEIQRNFSAPTPVPSVYVDKSSVCSVSTQLSLGFGLFAARNLKPDEVIVAFTLEGIKISNEEYEQRKQVGKGGYALRCNDEEVYDCYDAAVRRKVCLASMANDATNTVYVQDGTKPHQNAVCTRGPDRNGVPYFILRVRHGLHGIKECEEIFWNYASLYW